MAKTSLGLHLLFNPLLQSPCPLNKTLAALPVPNPPQPTPVAKPTTTPKVQGHCSAVAIGLTLVRGGEEEDIRRKGFFFLLNVKG